MHQAEQHHINDVILDIREKLAENGYLADDALVMTLYLAEKLAKPLLLEGPAGVGKTELAKAWSHLRGCLLIRLQCYEGLDESKALYEWNYQKQLLYIQIEALTSQEWEAGRAQLFSPDFLLKRPLLTALTSEQPVVLLIDEVDKSDPEFESFLLEALSDWQVTIPELGTIAAVTRPHVVLTSNSTRELGDALRRRCLHFHIDYPDFEREMKIVERHVPDIDRQFAKQLISFIQTVRKQPLKKPPSITESVDWVTAMHLTAENKLTAERVRITLSALLKHTRDRDLVLEKLPFLLRPK